MTLTGGSEALVDGAQALLSDAVVLRRRIHEHPELGLDLPRTQAAVLDALAGLDLSIRTGTDCTWVIADLRGGRGDGPTVLLRADMDALPMSEDTDLPFASANENTMHACGHDAHTAMLVGAAHLLHGLRDTFAGTVRFMFQPGEEGFHGARRMIHDGVLDGVSGAFAIHVTPNVPSGMVASRTGTILAAADEIYATIRGKGGHASQPHMANDPIPVACEAILALQTFVTRRIDVFNPVVVTIGSLHSGTTDNVIPETARIEGTIRSTSNHSREQAHAGVVRVFRNVAAAHDMEADVEVVSGYPVTVNDGAFVERIDRVCGDALGAGTFFPMPAPAMGAEDFSYVLEKVPGAMVFLGVCPPESSFLEAPGCHSNRMMIDEPAMATGIALHAAMALDMLADPPQR